MDTDARPFRTRSETISGDLLEEYREERLPRLGSVRANVWYLRQALSFVSVRSFGGPVMKLALTWMSIRSVSTRVRHSW
jgi:hypothetical protein